MPGCRGRKLVGTKPGQREPTGPLDTAALIAAREAQDRLYFKSVEPNPPAPLSVGPNGSVSTMTTSSQGTKSAGTS